MSYKLIVSGLAAGQEIQIDGLGLFKNGTYGVDNDQAEAFKSRHPAGRDKAPTVLQAFKSHPNIEVTKVSEAEADKLREPVQENQPTLPEEQNPTNEGGEK